MKNTKRILSALLAALMLLTVIPFGAFAEDGTYTVTVNFLLHGETAAQSYTGTFDEGANYSTSVPIPEIVGYTAQAPVGYDTDAVDVTFTATQLTYSFENLQADITLNVTYVPATVNYTVKYYQQNLEDDNYTLFTSETRTGLTEAQVAETYENLKNKYNGFYGLRFEEPSIAADGTTVVEIYYDRDYYLIDFVLGDGGYGVDPIFARYGAPVSVGTPTRAGYTFAGWDATVPSAMPAENKVITAKWNPNTVGYTVVFWYENPDDDGYSYMGSTSSTASAGSTVVSGSFRDTNFTGRDTTHFTYNPAKAETKTVAGDGSTVLNVYFKRNLYTLTFVDPDANVTRTVCGKEAHTHTDDCYNTENVCGLDAHTHGDDCYTEGIVCGKDEHTAHTSACYSGVGDKYTNSTSGWTHNNGNGSLHGEPVLVFFTTYYIYLDGSWYKYDGSRQSNNTIATPTCAGLHTHTDACNGQILTCTLPEHTHTDACKLNCGMEAHTHTSACNETSHKVKIITAKYEADLASYWPIVGDNGKTYTGQMWKSGNSSSGNKIVFLQKMPGENNTLNTFSRTGTTVYWYYYLEVLPGQTYETTRTDSGKTYYQYLSSSAITTALTYTEDYFPITGFTQRDSKVPSFSSNRAYLYYTRNSYTMKFNDNYGKTTNVSGTIYFDEVLGESRYMEPAYPTTLEAGAYKFGGWYTTSECFDGTEVDFNTFRMPAHNLELFAKWTPITHEAKFRVTFADDSEQLSDQIVPHGSFAETPDTPENGNYEFVGWFYMDDGAEKAYSPSLRITKDIDVYAKWRSNTLMSYRIQYQLEDGTSIADDTTGSALAGTTKTFEAKGGDALYADYQEGFFPTLKSHAVEMDINAEGEIVYTFVYEEAEAVPYTVKYLDRATGEPVAVQKYDANNRKAVVTERAATASGYLPEVFQQRLVISPDSDNVLIFYYNADTQHAIVSRTHYTVTGLTVTEYRHGEETGTIGQTYSAESITIENYTLSSIKVNDTDVDLDANLDRTLTEDGLNYEFYYTENNVTINYSAEQGGSVSSDSETVAIFSGTAAGSKAIPADGYRVSGWFTAAGAQANGTTTLNSDGSVTFVPAKQNGKNVAASYVAKFVKNEVIDKTVIFDFGLPVRIPFASPVTVTGISAAAPSETGITLTNAFTTAAVTSDYGTLSIDGNALVYTPGEKTLLDGIDTFWYSAQVETGFYRYAKITVVPATSVYYEDSFIKTKGEWETVGTAPTGSVTQLLKLAGESDVNYGYDPAYTSCSTYSLGTALKATVASGDTEAKYAYFTFKGTGFDIISLTDQTVGTIFVDVFNGEVDPFMADGSYSLDGLYTTWMVDAYSGLTCEQDGYTVYNWTKGADGLWHAETEHSETYVECDEITTTSKSGKTCEPNYIWKQKENSPSNYQVPVIKSPELTYGTYTVVITLGYMDFFDHPGSGSYDFYLDAIRVYNPAKNDTTAAEAYKADGEYDPEYIEIRDHLIKNGFGSFEDTETGAVIEGAVFIDGFGAVTGTDGLSKFTNFGPNNEVWLMPNQSVVFGLESKGVIESLQLGAKAVNGDASVRVNGNSVELKTATDMFYEILDYTNRTIRFADNVYETEIEPIVITNDSDAIVSLTTLKVLFHPEEETAPAKAPARLYTTRAMVAEAEKLVESGYIEDVLVEPDPFEPEKLNVILNKKSVKIGDRIKVTVTTSSEVERLTLNGTEMTAGKTNKKTGVTTWSGEVTVKSADDLTVSVVAYGGEGTAAEGKETVLTVEAKKNGVIDALKAALATPASVLSEIFG